MLLISIYSLFFIIAIGSFLITALPYVENSNGDDPLFLTPYLEKGNYIEAQTISKVQPDLGNMTSYSGFFTVNQKCESNLFFWFFPAQKDNWEDLPLLLWLQGGPGSSSMYGLFEELGPFESYTEGLEKRRYSWNNENNLLIIDQPVGTGYSFTGKRCFRTNETGVGDDLYSAVLQFHQLFPIFSKNKFFIAGESYAGHYIPALGHAIQKYNPFAKVKINLSAMMIGNGLSVAADQIDYGSYLYQLGLIDDEGLNVFKRYQELYKHEVQKENWNDASKLRMIILTFLYTKYVGGVNMYNYNYRRLHPRYQNYEEYIQLLETRKALHVGNLIFDQGDEAYAYLEFDISQSVKLWVQDLLEEYPIVFYNGQLDIICGYPMSENFIRSLSWSGQTQFLNATRSKWCVGEEQAGYFKGERNLYDVLVRGAGHMVPADQPHWAYILVNSVTSGTPDNPLHALKTCD